MEVDSGDGDGILAGASGTELDAWTGRGDGLTGTAAAEVGVAAGVEGAAAAADDEVTAGVDGEATGTDGVDGDSIGATLVVEGDPPTVTVTVF